VTLFTYTGPVFGLGPCDGGGSNFGCANSTETCNSIAIYVILTCILLDNKDTVQRLPKQRHSFLFGDKAANGALRNTVHGSVVLFVVL
jgi:hypothetical protein